MKKPHKASEGWVWYIYFPEDGWPEEHADLPEKLFNQLSGGKREEHKNGLITRIYSTEEEAVAALKAVS